MDVERLNRVLRRVRGEETLWDSSADRETLAALVRGEEKSRDTYGQLRNRCSGYARMVLTQLWNEEDRHYRNLQAEYMARYGDSLPRENQRPSNRQEGVLSALGRVREAEHSAAESYRRCSRETGDKRLAALYEKHGREEEQHALRITQLLHRGMG